MAAVGPRPRSASVGMVIIKVSIDTWPCTARLIIWRATRRRGPAPFIWFGQTEAEAEILSRYRPWLKWGGPRELFVPFAGSTKPRGTGLGVTSAADLIEAMGGRFKLRRSDASGTAFAIYCRLAPSLPRRVSCLKKNASHYFLLVSRKSWLH